MSLENTEPIGKRGSVLVTGAAGLVGRAVLSRLGHSLRVLGMVKEPPHRPLPSCGMTVVHDLRSQQHFDLGESPGTIVHLAQSSHYRSFPEGALDVFEVNAGSTQRLLDWACRNGVERFIYASSGGIYGHGDTAFEEDAELDPGAFLEHYLASKRCGELLVNSYRPHMIVVVLRFFFVYGPGQRRSMLIPRLIDNVRNDRPIALQGQNGIRLNPIFVDDAAAAIEAAIGLAASATINVAGPSVTTLRDIGALIGEATGREPKFEVNVDDPPAHLVGSTKKMTRLLGAPPTDIAGGLRRTMAEDRANLRNSHAG